MVDAIHVLGQLAHNIDSEARRLESYEEEEGIEWVTVRVALWNIASAIQQTRLDILAEQEQYQEHTNGN